MEHEQQGKTGFRCKPGDLAIVTKCGVSRRLGLIVRVIERCTDGGYDWLTVIKGRGVRGRDVHTGKIQTCKEALMHDWNLTPITGLGLQCQAETVEPAHVHESVGESLSR